MGALIPCEIILYDLQSSFCRNIALARFTILAITSSTHSEWEETSVGKMWLTLVLAGVRHIVQIHCRYFGRAR